jgi:hypothetical protein
MRRPCVSLCLWVLGGAWAVACGSDGGSGAAGNAGEGGGGDVAEAGAATDAGESAGGTLAAGGAPATAAGASSEAGAGDVAGAPSGGAGAPSADYGQLLFDLPGVGAIGTGGLFRTGIGLVWLYELDGKSFVATGPATGGERVDLIESDEAITVFNVRSTIAYQAAEKLFTHPLSATALTPVELEGAPTCVALSSAAGFVYCRSTEGTIVRWSESGGAGTVLATGVPPGFDLVADAAPVNPLNRKLYFCEDAGAVSSIPLTGFGGTAITPPQYIQINKQELSPRGLHVGVTGDDVLYWINVPDGAAARVRGSAKTTPPVTNAGPPLDSTRIFTPYSWSAGAIIAIEHADESAQIAFVRFGQSFITPHFESIDGVVALTAEQGRYYWLDRSARVFSGAPK